MFTFQPFSFIIGFIIGGMGAFVYLSLFPAKKK